MQDQSNSASVNHSWKQGLSKYNNLTPGDFATVVRQARLNSHPLTEESLLAGLVRESKFKQSNQSAGIGFTAHI
jgi:hypothetical protein